MSIRPPPYPPKRKDDPSFDFFIEDLTASVTDIHRGLDTFEKVNPPSAKTDNGKPGMVAQDENYFYWCYATNSWNRVEKDNTW